MKFQYGDCCHRLSKCAAPQPDVLMALPRKMSLKRTLNSKRQKLQSDSRSISYPPPKDAAFSILDKFQHMILCGCGSVQNRRQKVFNRGSLALCGGD